ncbi:Hypothetical protein A7982_05108 [Minicystis rosea]|nr:Hypothetical protein A7982_05108 [Minicystis rosea]
MYRPPEGEAWYHFLHGNVPGHQIDFIHRPEVPDGPLSRQHFSHLARLMRYVEPESHARFAFSIGNLSRDDVQHEPGHGGLCLLFGLRIRGVTEHAGRLDPPFAHAIAAVDRVLDEGTLIATAIAFHRLVLGGAASEEWYRDYVRRAPEGPAAVRSALDRYMARFAELPRPSSNGSGPAWITEGAQQPRRIVVVHDDDATFGEIAVTAARIAAVLYRSDIRWTVISTGREGDIPNGVSVRLRARGSLGSADASGSIHDMGDLPDDEVGLAEQLFGATPVGGPRPSHVTARRFGGRFVLPIGVSRRLEEAAARPLSAPPAPRDAPSDCDDIDVEFTAEDIPAFRPPPLPPARPPPLPPMRRPPPPLPPVRRPAPTLVDGTVPAFSAAPRRLGRWRLSRSFWWIAGGISALALGLVAFLALSDDASPAPGAAESSAPSASAAPVVSVAPLWNATPESTAVPAPPAPSSKPRDMRVRKPPSTKPATRVAPRPSSSAPSRQGTSRSGSSAR